LRKSPFSADLGGTIVNGNDISSEFLVSAPDYKCLLNTFAALLGYPVL
jgi:hypothetical protein